MRPPLNYCSEGAYAPKVNTFPFQRPEDSAQLKALKGVLRSLLEERRG